MPKGRRLNDLEKGQIRAYKDTGKSNNWIARKLNRSSTVIDNFVKVLL
jgi:IS30 family transposase